MTADLIGGPPPAAVAADPHWAAKMDRLRNRKPAERTLLIRLDDASVDAARAARTARQSAQVAANASPDDDAAQARLELAEQTLAGAEADLALATVSLTFRSLPRDSYEQLIADCPPTAEQEADGQTYDPETFAPALVSACCTDDMPVADAKELLATLSQLEAGLLFEACIGLNERARMDFGSPGNG